jgi:hypothetical protein
VAGTSKRTPQRAKTAAPAGRSGKAKPLRADEPEAKAAAEPEAVPVEASTPVDKATPTRRPKSADKPESPGWNLVLVVLAVAMVVFAGRLAALRGLVADVPDVQTVNALAIFALPPIISASLLVGAATGLAAALWRRRGAPALRVRLALGAAAGVVAALVTGGALYASSGSVLVAAVAVAVAALLGGLISAVRIPVLAAGLAAALGVAVIQFGAALFTAELRGLLDGSGSGQEVGNAELQLALIVGIVAGVVAGLVSYAVLRRLRPGGLPGHVAAGAAAGAFLLVAEVVSRVTVPLLVRAAGGSTGDDPLVVQLTGQARLNSALVVFFVGAITGVITLGRSMPKRPAKPMKPRVSPRQSGD